MNEYMRSYKDTHCWILFGFCFVWIWGWILYGIGGDSRPTRKALEAD